MNKFIGIFFLWALSAHTFSQDKPSNECIRSAYADYTKGFTGYWKLIGEEFKAENPELYSEFSYLVKEQLNRSRMSVIKLDYLLENYPEKLELEKQIYRVTPSYANYSNKIFRELRGIDEYSKLYLENQSTDPNILMPNYERLQAARDLFAKIQGMDNVLAYQRKLEKDISKPVMELSCGS
jgi:hypothetical protein